MKIFFILIGILLYIEINLIGWVVIFLFFDFVKNVNENYLILFGIKIVFYFVKGEVFFWIVSIKKSVFYF